MLARKVTLHTGESVDITSLLGEKGTILFFFPKAFSPLCEQEVIAYQNKIIEFKELGYTVVGVSPDSVNVLDEFCNAIKLEYKLVCDQSFEIADYFKLNKTDFEGKKMVERLERSTFILDRNANILKSFRNVHETKHIQEVLSYLSK